MDFSAEAVGEAMRQTFEVAVRPHFQNLKTSDIREKRPGNQVTIADEAAERLLSSRLEALWPGSCATGEEAIERGEFDARRLEGEGRFWCLDPIDGTRAFIAGNRRFTMLVSAIQNGVSIGAFALSPIEERFAAIVAGGKLVMQGPGASRARAARLSEARIVAHRSIGDRKAGGILKRLEERSNDCAHSIGFGIDFLDLVFAERDAVLFTSASPWEFPCGVMLAQAMGGLVRASDGSAPIAFPKVKGLHVASHSEDLIGEILEVVAQAGSHAHS
jgi:fructose-1,6-bisphosphatase/inositol monophosphatase family enzyme